MTQSDLILLSNSIFTGLNDVAKPGFVAVNNEKIVFVGNEEDVEAYIGAKTKVHNLGDQTIMAGFHDAHMHLMLGSLFNNSSVHLKSALSANEVAIMVKNFAGKRKNDTWIIENGWDSGNWGDNNFPHRSALDGAIPDRPVILFHAEGHYAWVNSKALEIANITSQTSPPPYGTIQKDSNGDPTGILMESAISLVSDKALTLPKERQNELLKSFLSHSASCGVTSVNDLYPSRAHAGLEDYEFYREFEDKEKLTTRIHLYPAMNGDIERAKKLRDMYNSKKLKFVGLKQFIDGVVTGYTALLLDPYVDRPETKGEIAFPYEQIKEWVLEADREGFQIRFHSIGDGAVRLGLDVFEEAQKINGKRDARHALEHIEVIHPKDIIRFKKLGVIPSIQPSHLALMPSENHTSRIGYEKDHYAYTCQSLHEAGGRLAFGTDFPISPLDPIKEIYHAVTRKDFTGNQKWNEQECISLSDALKAYTIGAAQSVFREHELGTLEAGKLADIVVLNKNLFSVPKEKVKETEVSMTIMNGEIVYVDSK